MWYFRTWALQVKKVEQELKHYHNIANGYEIA